MAIDKIQAESMNLADTFAFTGTVSGASNLVKLSTVTISGTSTTNIDFDNLFTSDYDVYKFYFDRVTSITDNAFLYVRFFTSSGIIDASDYVHVSSAAQRNISTDASGNTYNAGEGTFMRVNSDVGTNDDDQYAMNYEFTLINPLNTTSYKQIKFLSSTISSGHTTYQSVQGSGFYKQTTALRGVRFYFSSGNWKEPSSATMYGVKK
tara:strand:+ start:333 stop:953 length:621 start_codon:yes stop_codon:yes gene_type:complete